MKTSRGTAQPGPVQMSACPPEQTAQFEFQQGLVSTATQLWPSGQPVAGSQSAASKQPAVKPVDPQPGTSQRQLPADAHMSDVVRAEQSSIAGHGGVETCHVPPAVHCALGPHSPAGAKGQTSVQHASQEAPAVGSSVGQEQIGPIPTGS
jgi:hypothetical protein